MSTTTNRSQGTALAALEDTKVTERDWSGDEQDIPRYNSRGERINPEHRTGIHGEARTEGISVNVSPSTKMYLDRMVESDVVPVETLSHAAALCIQRALGFEE